MNVIDAQVQEALEMLNQKLHGCVDYSLFCEIFDFVAEIGVPSEYSIVPNYPDMDMQVAGLKTHYGYDNVDTKSVYEAMISEFNNRG